jgi:AcrR family transcriptional regulator
MPKRSAPRLNQRARTREALLEAGRAMVNEGDVPTVVEAARRARISTATAYRYFPDQQSLLAQAVQGQGRIPGFLPDLKGSDPAERAAQAAEQLLRRVLQRERLVRTVMGLSLLKSAEPGSKGSDATSMRPGNRFAYIDQALEPLRGTLEAAPLERLRKSLAIAISSEALVALVDVAGLAREEAVKVCAATARSLVEAALMRPRLRKPKGR